MRLNKLVSTVIGITLASTTVFLVSSVSSAGAANPNCRDIDGDYIVTFARNVNAQSEMNAAPGKSISPKFTYDVAVNGFAASLSAEQVCAFRKRPNIESIELDGQIDASAFTLASTSAASWGLDRVDETNRALDGKYDYFSDGTGIKAYIIDTGIYSKQSDFTGRLLAGYSAIRSGGTEDCNGHGTHVSGTVGGTKYGIAKKVSLVPVRVLDCKGSGATSGVIAGVNWVATNATPGRSVANMSLGGGFSSTLNSAVANLIAKGVVVVVAAGNSNMDACKSSPASVGAAITVGATDNSDAFASFSNFGACVDISAPGVSITSDWIRSATDINIISGTSMATPHVTGAVARYLSNGISAAGIISDSTKGAVTGNLRGTVNNFLYLDRNK